jgi:hypothetical protein
MGAWVATVLRDLFHFHDTGSPFSRPAPPTAGATRTGNASAGGSHVR